MLFAFLYHEEHEEGRELNTEVTEDTENFKEMPAA